MMVDLDKNSDKDVFHTMKWEVGYSPKSTWNKISHVNFCKLAQITKKKDNFGQVVPPFDIKL